MNKAIRKTKMFNSLRICVVATALVLCWASAAAAFELTYEGYLTDLDNAPLGGAVSMTFALYTSDSGGDPLWEEGHSVTVSDGHFTVQLGDGQELPEDPPARLFLEVRVERDVIEPRVPVTGAMFAQRAAVADDVPGRDITPRTVSIQGAGEVIDEDGNWVGGLAQTDLDDDGFADVVEVLLGTDPDNRNDVPADENDDGIPDALQGTPGQGANSQEVAALLLMDEEFRANVAAALFDGHAQELRGEDADPDEVADALSLDDTFRDLLALTLATDYAEQLRGPQGDPGEGGALRPPTPLKGPPSPPSSLGAVTPEGSPSDGGGPYLPLSSSRSSGGRSAGSDSNGSRAPPLGR